MQENSFGSITDSQTATGDDDMVVHARKLLKMSKAKQRLLLVLIAKDLADALIAIQDLLGTIPLLMNNHGPAGLLQHQHNLLAAHGFPVIGLMRMT